MTEAIIIVVSVAGYVVMAEVTGAVAQIMHDHHGFGCTSDECCWVLLGLIWPIFWAWTILVTGPYQGIGALGRWAKGRKLPKARVIER